jgi:hypothetical protein
VDVKKKKMQSVEENQEGKAETLNKTKQKVDKISLILGS